MHPLTITRTVYDPATKEFVFDSAESKALPNIRQWINKKNPVIYWYVLRVDNQSELLLDQWAIELYTHQALNITDAYIDGIDRCFELKKREHDSWSDKYVLSIPKQLGIPIVGKGTRRVFFKVDINCKEGLMHEYGISGRFISSGVEPVDIKEKFFQYSCKVGEFRQIFNNNPDEASVYAEKRLSTRYSDNDIHLFTNSFRMIHDLYRYCHSGPVQKDELMHKLRLLYANFERVPDIAKEKINPLLYDGIRELELIRNIDNFKSRYIHLCDSLVELLHIEVMGTNPVKGAIAAQENETPSRRTGYVSGDENISRQDGHTAGTGNRECPVCKNIIDSSNKSIICKQCGSRFCQTCESWFREPRKTGESLLCETCFAAERDEKIRTERERALAQEVIRLKTAEEAENKGKKEAQRQWQEEQKLRTEREKQERLRKEQEEQRRKEAELKAQEAAHLKAAKEEAERAQHRKEDDQGKSKRKKMFVIAIVVLVGCWIVFPSLGINSISSSQEPYLWNNETKIDHLALDSTGAIYAVTPAIGASNNASSIIKFDNNSNSIATWNLYDSGKARNKVNDEISHWVSEGGTVYEYNIADDISVDSFGNIYILYEYFATGIFSNLIETVYFIQKYDSNGDFVTEWGSENIGDGQFENLNDIAVDSSGNVYATYKNQILKYDSSGRFITKWSSKNNSTYYQDIAIDSLGHIYVLEYHSIKKLDSGGNLVLEWGSKGDDDGQIDFANSIAVDSFGNVYVADTVKSNTLRIQKFDISGNYIAKWIFEGRDFRYANNIDVDSLENVYFSNNRGIWKISL